MSSDKPAQVNCGNDLGTFVASGLGAVSGTLLVNHYFLNKQPLSQGQIALCGSIALQAFLIEKFLEEIIISASTGKATDCDNKYLTIEDYVSIALFLYVVYAVVTSPDAHGKGVLPGGLGAIIMSSIFVRLLGAATRSPPATPPG